MNLSPPAEEDEEGSLLSTMPPPPPPPPVRENTSKDGCLELFLSFLILAVKL